MILSQKIIAVQHERAPRGALKRSYQPEYQPAASTASMVSAPLLPALHHHQQPPITSMNTGYSFYSGNFPFPWRPSALGVLHHAPRHFPLNILVPPPPAPILDSDNLLATSTPSLLNLVKENEVSSSAVEEAPILKRRDTGFLFFFFLASCIYFDLICRNILPHIFFIKTKHTYFKLMQSYYRRSIDAQIH